MTDTLTQRRIARLWLPMAATWAMMSLEGPFLAAIIARLPDSTANLAAYGVAFTLAMLFESPIILIMSASTALVADRQAMVALRRYTSWMNAAITAAMGVLVVPPVFRAFGEHALRLPPDVSALAGRACLVLLPWPAAIGYRRFYQGLLVRSGLTRRVAYGTVVRLSSMAATGLVLALAVHADGAIVGAGALTAGVVMEAAASRVMTWPTVARLKRGATIGRPRSEPLAWAGFVRFYTPLALTSVLALGINPIVTFFLGRARLGLESLAVMPVVNPLVFLFGSIGLAFQEVAIALLGLDPAHRPPLRRFAARLALGGSGALLALAFSPALDSWLSGASGLSPELARLAHAPIRVLILMPALSVLICFQRAQLVAAHATRPVSWATAIEVIGVVVLLWAATGPAALVGATAAACALLGGRIAAVGYLQRVLRRLRAVRAPAAVAPAPVEP